MDGFFPCLPLNPLHPLADGEAVAAGFKKQIPISKSKSLSVISDCGRSRAGVICDTGSRCCYAMDPALVQHGVKVEDLDDYNPILGRLRSPSWNVDFSIVGDRGPALCHSDRMGLLGGAALGPMVPRGQASGVSGLVGNRWLSRARIGLDAAAARGNEVLLLAEAR